MKRLHESHLLPASVYKKIRSVYPTSAYKLNPDPIEVTSGRARQTSKQITDKVLCSDCESVLDRMGEDHALPLLANAGGFPLYELLTGSPSRDSDAGLSIYLGANVPSLDCDKMIHFACGIFWKAAAHSWRSGPSTVKLNLKGHEERLREYLLGVKGFPDDVVLCIRVVPPIVPLLWAVAPVSASNAHFFYVPGIEFSLHAESRAVRELWEGCFVHNAGHPVFVDASVGLTIGKLHRETFLPAKKSTRLSDGLRRRREPL